MTAENQHDLDLAALAREADAVPLPDTAELVAATGSSDEPGSPGEPAPSASWAPITPGIVAGVDLFVCPGWKLTDAEKTALADALTPALDQAFPGGLGDEKYASWVRLLIVTGGIVALRYDRDTGRLAPLREKKAAKPEADAAPPASPFTT